MSWQAFREAEQRANDAFTRRELERQRAGDPLFSADKPTLFDYTAKNAQRLYMLDAQRANPGSVISKRPGDDEFQLRSPTTSAGNGGSTAHLTRSPLLLLGAGALALMAVMK